METCAFECFNWAATTYSLFHNNHLIYHSLSLACGHGCLYACKYNYTCEEEILQCYHKFLLAILQCHQ